MSDTYSEVKKIVIGILVIGAALGIVCLILFGAFVAHEAQKDKDRQEWAWQHYTGYRLVSELTTGVFSFRLTEGINIDQKTGEQCTTQKYPDYPDCPPQEYVINGQPASAPQGNFDFGFKPTQAPTPQPEVEPAKCLLEPPAGFETPVLDGHSHLPQCERGLKTGIVFLLKSCLAPPNCLACCPPDPIGATLYSDAQRHLSSSDAIPFGTKITILGRKNGVPILDKDGFTSGYSDLVHVSVLGKIGWLEADSVEEDPEKVQ